jgi:hypothetical protein
MLPPAPIPLQMVEMEHLKTGLEEFFLSVRGFRTKFRAEAPFTFTGDPLLAYADLDTHAEVLTGKEAEAKRYNELEELFELQVRIVYLYCVCVFCVICSMYFELLCIVYMILVLNPLYYLYHTPMLTLLLYTHIYIHYTHTYIHNTHIYTIHHTHRSPSTLR